MHILKAREIDPILYEEAKKLRVSEKEINDAYDYFEDTSERKKLQERLETVEEKLKSFEDKDGNINEGRLRLKGSLNRYKGLKSERDKLKLDIKDKDTEETTNPLSYKFTDNESKVMFPRMIREFTSNLKLKDTKTLTEDDIDEFDKIKDTLYRLALFGQDIKIGSKKKKVSSAERKVKGLSKLLTRAFESIAASGFREQDVDIQNLKNTKAQKDMNKIQDFFLEGRPITYLHDILLENKMAKWDNKKEDWLLDGKIAYKKYGTKNSKELFTELQEGLGFGELTSKDIVGTRESLLEHFELDNYEPLIEELMTLVVKNADEYTQKDEKLLFRSNYSKLESALMEIAMETIELQDKLESHIKKPLQSDLDSVEKYLDVAEFIIAVLKLRGDYRDIPQIEEPLIDIDEPRDIDLERDFPELEQAGENYLEKTNVRKRLDD
tara:strand:- start:1478 stop:2791 length:1314 start_codon:yes stop_codon:yes gene_type:complete